MCRATSLGVEADPDAVVRDGVGADLAAQPEGAVVVFVTGRQADRPRQRHAAKAVRAALVGQDAVERSADGRLLDCFRVDRRASAVAPLFTGSDDEFALAATGARAEEKRDG